MKVLSKMARSFKFIDIGANLTDAMYQGLYHGSKKHAPDLESVLSRSWEGGMEKIIVTGGTVSDCEEALQLAQQDDKLYSTVGCHPTRCSEFLPDPEGYLATLKDIIKRGGKKIVAIGECGLDYDRLKFCNKNVQKQYFEYQLQLCDEFRLPLFLHCRAASDDFYDIMSRNKSRIHGGVVHSFDGTEQDIEKAVQLGLYIGINGCSLKTEENLKVAAKIPSERLLIETDCPWCEVKKTHAGFKHVKTQFNSVKKEKFTAGSLVNGRNEPVRIIQVLEVLSGIRNEDINVLSEQIFDNTNRLFFND